MTRASPVVAIVAALGLAGAAAAGSAAGRAILVRPPYLGVSCPRSNSFACDRVGLAVWLRRPAVRLEATINGRPVRMRRPSSSNCGPGKYNGPCGSYFEGFLRPAGLKCGPLEVTPDEQPDIWVGRHPVRPALVRLTASYADGGRSSISVRVPLHPGWG